MARQAKDKTLKMMGINLLFVAVFCWAVKFLTQVNLIVDFNHLAPNSLRACRTLCNQMTIVVQFLFFHDFKPFKYRKHLCRQKTDPILVGGGCRRAQWCHYLANSCVVYLTIGL